MQIYSDSELIFLNRVNDIAFCWRNFVANLIFSICYAPLTLIFGFLEENIEKIIESRYIGIFLIIGKIIDIDMKFLNLSVIWRNYRQNYRYRNWLEIYRKIIDIEKNDLSPTPNQGSFSWSMAGQHSPSFPLSLMHLTEFEREKCATKRGEMGQI